MKELRLHAITLNFTPAVGHFRLRIYLENKHMVLNRIYESRFLNSGKRESPTVINEAFRFEPERGQQYLKLVVDYWSVDEESSGDKTKRIQRKAYVFMEDLNQNSSEFKVTISKTQSITLFYEFTGVSLVTKDGQIQLVSSQLSLSRSSIEDLSTITEHDPGMLELYKTTYKFVRRITPLRRLENKVGAFIGEKDLRRDCWAAAIAVLFLYYGTYLAILLLAILVLSDWKYRLREWILITSEALFSGTPTPVEIKKNLLHIREQQLFFMGLIKKLRSVFYTPNRELLFIVTNKIFIAGIVGIFILTFIPLRIILTFAIPFAVIRKYQKNEMIVKESPPNTALLVIDSVTENLGKLSKRLLAKHGKKIYKLCFYYENQRWYFPQGFQAKTFIGGYLIRKAKLLRRSGLRGPGPG
jgi:hypothetical protein